MADQSPPLSEGHQKDLELVRSAMRAILDGSESGFDPGSQVLAAQVLMGTYYAEYQKVK